ncbi:PAS domain-containing sensor histidine kinase [Myxococcota bacterium]|nr:PAS domain-containing sensor histidine kinase [Myxococcota bacterium]
MTAARRDLPRLPAGPIEGVDFGIYEIDDTCADSSLLVAIGREENFEPLTEDARNEFAHVLEHAPDAVMVCNEGARITYLNAEAKRWLGGDCTEMLGAPLTILLSEPSAVESVIGACSQALPLQDEIFHLRSRGGARRCASVSSGRIDNPLGSLVVFYLRDVGARVGDDTAMSRRHADFERDVASLAHDLRSPLSSMRAFVTLLSQQFADRLGETENRFLERIDQAGRRMETLVHDILETPHLNRNRAPRSVHSVDPSPILDQLSQEVKPLLDEGGIELIVPDSPPRLYCGETDLYRVLSNLVGNAIEHMGKCDPRRIEVEIIDEGHQQHLKVGDRGQGMRYPPTPEGSELDPTADRPPEALTVRGFGMGLKIVKSIAENHGGSVWVESRAGLGTTIHVTFGSRP